MSALPPPRAISLDMDGTVYRVRRLRVLWRLRWERGLLLALIAAREKIRHEGELPDAEALAWREAELVAPSFELPVEEALRRIRDLRAAMPAALTLGAAPYRGLASALAVARARGVKLAIFSDYAPEEKLRNLGLDELPWAATSAAERFGALKPHRRSFLELAKALDVEPGQIVHIGDREDLDVEGALAAGLRAWRFAKRRDVPTRAEHVFDRWSVSTFSPFFGAAG